MDTSALFLFVGVVLLALTFDFTNGFHGTANSIATVVGTRALSPKIAVIYASILNFIGALMGTAVAMTVGKGLVSQSALNIQILLAALISAILWNLFTWYKGLPTSSSHALIGSLIGATIFGLPHGLTHVHIHSLLDKVILPMFMTPFIAFGIAFSITLVLVWLVFKFPLPSINRIASKLQILSSGLVSISHGHNDAQKTMGIVALAVAVTFPSVGFHVSLWIIISCALAMGLGTMIGGWRIVHTVGSKMVHIDPLKGFAAETSSALIIMVISEMGIPISTSEVVAPAILGTSRAHGQDKARWSVCTSILTAWVLTIPSTILLAGGLSMLFLHF